LDNAFTAASRTICGPSSEQTSDVGLLFFVELFWSDWLFCWAYYSSTSNVIAIIFSTSVTKRLAHLSFGPKPYATNRDCHQPKYAGPPRKLQYTNEKANHSS